MTTIAYKNGIMAADSRGVKGATIATVPYSKIHVPEGDDYWEIEGVKVLCFGMAGMATFKELVKERLRKNLTSKNKTVEEDKVSFQALIIDENGGIWDWGVSINARKDHSLNQLLPVSAPMTIGSGGPFALAAMAVGLTAKAAVKVAGRLDPHTNDIVTTWSFPGKPDVPSVRPVPLVTVIEGAPA